MLKALKLFAKNHQQLEKVVSQDPHSSTVANNRRVLSYDGRKANGHFPASTFEKCGGSVSASGPKFLNELVEKELANYKVEVEQKFKASHVNQTFVF